MIQEDFMTKLYEKYQEFDKEHFIDFTEKLYPNLINAAVGGDRNAILEIRRRINEDAAMYNINNEDDYGKLIALMLMDIYWHEVLEG